MDTAASPSPANGLAFGNELRRTTAQDGMINPPTHRKAQCLQEDHDHG